MHLLYFADPLCSWCYGFGPQLSKLLERHPGTRLDLVMGGLRPYNTQKMTPEFKEMLRGHWRHVATASGLPFSEALLDREDFVYDTEPACRAVVTARDMDVSKAYPFMKALQLAFYRDGREVTQGDVLADIAQECGYQRDIFRMNLDSELMREETKSDFATTQTLGVSGFPTLGTSHGSQLFLVTSGYVTDDVLEYRLAEIERLRALRAAGSGGPG
jgi:putative protein-disulfide isomerase